MDYVISPPINKPNSHLRLSISCIFCVFETEMALLPSSLPSSTNQIHLSTDQIHLPTLENLTTDSDLQTQQQQEQEAQQQLQQKQDDASKEVVGGYECKPYLVNAFLDSDTAEYMAKYNKYEADYVRRIKAKYFSKKSMTAVNIFDVETPVGDEIIGDEIIKSSRLQCTQSFIDPIQSSEDQSRLSTSVAEASTNTTNRKYQGKKSS